MTRGRCTAETVATPSGSMQLLNRQREERTSESHERGLLGRIEARDREAMRELYLLYYRRLARFLRRMTRRHAFVDEVVNDTFVIVWQKAGDFRGDSRVSTWIMGIAYRRGLSLLRTESRADQHLMVPITQDQQSSLEGGERSEMADLLDRAMDCLSPDHRAVIEMTYYLGYSCDEIAVIVDCPTNTVKTRMFHARNKLRVLVPMLAAPRPGMGTAA
jgi:RNA polymerase sigma-70 factor, ECF subfamily